MLTHLSVLERLTKRVRRRYRYAIWSMGVCSIPRTATTEHLKQNLDVYDFKLSDAEMAELKKLNETNMRVVNPPHAPKWDTP